MIKTEKKTGFEKIFDKIGLDDVGKESFYEIDKRTADEEFRKCVSRSYEEYEKGDEEFAAYLAVFAEYEKIKIESLNLYIYLRMSADSLEKYRQMGIDDDIFYATFGELSVLCATAYRTEGIYGISQKGIRRWLRHYINCRIFRLGRLNFHITGSEYDADIEGRHIAKGDTCISVHIPKAARLEEAECEAAYDEARRFFKKYFGVDECIFLCYSWLLQPWLAEVLPESSLIVRFQSKYKIIDFAESPGDMLHWVFPKTEENAENYPEDTSLRRATKARLLNGLPVGYGSGIRL